MPGRNRIKRGGESPKGPHRSVTIKSAERRTWTTRELPRLRGRQEPTQVVVMLKTSTSEPGMEQNFGGV